MLYERKWKKKLQNSIPALRHSYTDNNNLTFILRKIHVNMIKNNSITYLFRKFITKCFYIKDFCSWAIVAYSKKNTNSGDKHYKLSRHFYINLRFPMLVNMHFQK